MCTLFFKDQKLRDPSYKVSIMYLGQSGNGHKNDLSLIFSPFKSGWLVVGQIQDRYIVVLLRDLLVVYRHVFIS